MKKIFHIFLLSLLAFVPVSDATSQEEMGFDNAKPTAVRFFATWCGRCKILDERLEAIRPEFEDKINFVVLEMTSIKSREAAKMQAMHYGLDRVAQKYWKKTGVMVLVNRYGREQAALNYKATDEEIKEYLNKLITQGERS